MKTVTYDIDFYNKFNPDRTNYSSRIYFGKEISIKFDNAELIFPENALKEETIISIEQNFEIKREAKRFKISNKIKCEPHGIKFLKPVLLRMKAIAGAENKTIEREINKFSEHGINSIWKKKIFLLF